MFCGIGALMLCQGEPSTLAVVPFSLGVACLLMLRLLLKLRHVSQLLILITGLAAAGLLLLWLPVACIPFVILLGLEQAAAHSDINWATALCLIAALILILALTPSAAIILLTTGGIALGAIGIAITTRLESARLEQTRKNEQIAQLSAQLNRQREIIAAIENQSRAAERSRMAARIHDKVGHGVTGSILLLEAALLQMRDNGEAARSSINKAAENLRETVDGIRSDLQTERGNAKNNHASLALIAAELESLCSMHPEIKTILKTNGMLDNLQQTIWLCVYQNLLESITNMLKHMQAKQLRVNISARFGIIVVEFLCTGASEQDTLLPIIKGIGLAAIEERTLLAGGRCFFERTTLGFTTRMTFLGKH
jgi:signal transduction histidine kinase